MKSTYSLFLAAAVSVFGLTGCETFKSKQDAAFDKAKASFRYYCETVRPETQIDDYLRAGISLATVEGAGDLAKVGMDKACEWIGKPAEPKQAAQ